MNRAVRRTVTITGTTLGALALMAGPAAAHYCYMLVPQGSARVDSAAWSTADEVIEHLPPFIQGPCRTAVIAHIEALEAQGALFMGPGLLAAGAIRQGKGPATMGHLAEDVQTIPACAPPPPPS